MGSEMCIRDSSKRFSLPKATSLLSRRKDRPERIPPQKTRGNANLYKLIPEAFMAVHSFRFTIEPRLKTVEIKTAIGKPILIK